MDTVNNDSFMGCEEGNNLLSSSCRVSLNALFLKKALSLAFCHVLALFLLLCINHFLCHCDKDVADNGDYMKQRESTPIAIFYCN